MSTDTLTKPDNATHFDAADQLLSDVLERARNGRDEPLTAQERQAAVKANNEQAQKWLRLFGRTMTQGDWLTITRLLDMSREDIGEDQNLVLLAFAYVKEKRAHGEASIDILLELTDRQLLAAHGFAHDPDDDDEDDKSTAG